MYLAICLLIVLSSTNAQTWIVSVPYLMYRKLTVPLQFDLWSLPLIRTSLPSCFVPISPILAYFFVNLISGSQSDLFKARSPNKCAQISFSSFTNLFYSSSFFATAAAFSAFSLSFSAFLSPFLLGFFASSAPVAYSSAGYSFFYAGASPFGAFAGALTGALAAAGFTSWTGLDFLTAGGASLRISYAHLKWDARLYHANVCGWTETLGALFPMIFMASLSASPGSSPSSHY